MTTLVFVASDVDRSRRLYKAIQKHATIVECWGLKGGKDGRVDLRQAARTAEALVKQAVAEGRPLREIVLEKGLLTPEEVDRVLDVEAMTKGGVL